MKTLKALAFLMAYPSADTQMAGGEIADVLKAEGWLPAATVQGIEKFMAECAAADIYDLQEDYVGLFDRTPSLCLHLFEHVHGDSRDRGQALVELDMLYRERGLENNSEHTPDYLPLFLEYLSTLPPDEARENLDGAIDVIAVLGERLKKRESGYAILFDALQEAAARKPDPKKLQSALAFNAGHEPTQDEMDEAWEQQFAFAGAKDDNGGGCPKARDMLKRMETGS